MKILKFIFLINLLVVGMVFIQSCQNDDDSPDTEICDDGIDNDGDGFVDCDDNDCSSDPICAVEICDDGIDNDGDGFVDCDDNDCSSDPSC